MSLNNVIVMGHLTADPEAKGQEGNVVVFSIGTNRRWTGQDGTKHDESSFFDIVAFGKTGENILKFFTKGKPIIVQGRLQQERWEDRETGGKRSKVKIVCELFHFVGSKDDQGSGGNNDDSGGSSQAAPAGQAATKSNDGIDYDSIPF